MSSPAIPASHSGSLMQRFLNAVERVGNRLPDPAVLFVLLLLVVVALSFLLSGQDFGLIDPRDGKPLVVKNLAAPEHFIPTELLVVWNSAGLGRELQLPSYVKQLTEFAKALAFEPAGVLAFAPMLLMTLSTRNRVA